MSGFAFAASRDPSRPRASVDAMLDRMVHRGPDARKTREVSTPGFCACLGHLARWTALEDVGTSQPRESALGNLITFDGRLDNRAELSRLLALDPSSCDAAFALAAFETWAERSPRFLLGDFAFVIWEAHTGRVFAARDRLGLVSLYYRSDASKLQIASEQQALFVDGETPKPNLATLASALVEEYCERGPTLYEGVQALEPGSSLVWRDGKLETQTYWELDVHRELRGRSEADCAEEYRAVLREAVLARMRARGPVAIGVSGGIDSSSIAALAVGIAREGLAPMPVLVTTRYPRLACDEIEHSSRLAAHLGQPLRVIDAPTSGYEPPEPREIYYDPAFQLWQRMLEACKSDGVYAYLTGMGSDEIMWSTGLEVEDAVLDRDFALAARFAGLYADPTAWRAWRRLGGAVKRAWRAPRPGPRLGERERIPKWITPHSADLIRRAREDRRAQSSSLFHSQASRERVAVELAFGSQVPFGIAQYVQYGPHLGVDLRNPFYDSRVVELALALPLRVRHALDLSKPLLRRAMEPLLPPSLVWRTGGAEFTSFFHSAFYSHEPLTRSLFTDSRLEALGVVRPGALLELLEAGRSDPERTRDLLATFAYEAWVRKLER